MRPRLPRRTFLKLSGTTLGAALLPRPSLRLAATLPLPCPHSFFPSAEALLPHLATFDLALLPAYAAAQLIQSHQLRVIPGQPGRAHDPDGAYALPYGTASTTILYRAAPPTSADLWTHATLWPDSPRFVLGHALMRRGYSPNDSHPGHLAQIESDLLDARPQLMTDPESALRAGCGDFAVTLALGELPYPGVKSLPITAITGQPAILLEHDWVIPLSSAKPDLALDFITSHSSPARPSPLDAPPLPPAPRPRALMPLAPRPLAHYQNLWSRLKETR